MEVIVVDKRWM